jgi:hypothetical protein
MRRLDKRYSFLVRRALLVLLSLLAVTAVSDDAGAAEPTPVVVTMKGKGRVRLEVAAGSTLPCDSSANTPLFDGWIEGGQVFNSATTEACVCVRHTSKSFPTSGWSTPGLACRKQICRGRICRPAPDQTIRANLSTE